jgi:hypothetical protein
VVIVACTVPVIAGTVAAPVAAAVVPAAGEAALLTVDVAALVADRVGVGVQTGTKPLTVGWGVAPAADVPPAEGDDVRPAEGVRLACPAGVEPNVPAPPDVLVSPADGVVSNAPVPVVLVPPSDDGPPPDSRVGAPAGVEPSLVVPLGLGAQAATRATARTAPRTSILLMCFSFSKVYASTYGPMRRFLYFLRVFLSNTGVHDQ